MSPTLRRAITQNTRRVRYRPLLMCAESLLFECIHAHYRPLRISRLSSAECIVHNLADKRSKVQNISQATTRNARRVHYSPYPVVCSLSLNCTQTHTHRFTVCAMGGACCRPVAKAQSRAGPGQAMQSAAYLHYHQVHAADVERPPRRSNCRAQILWRTFAWRAVGGGDSRRKLKKSTHRETRTRNL